MAKRRGRNSRGVGNKEKDDKEKDEEKEKDKEPGASQGSQKKDEKEQERQKRRRRERKERKEKAGIDLEKVARQLDFYFSDANLRRDRYMKKTLDEGDGAVSLEILLNFNRIKALGVTKTSQLLEAVQCSGMLDLVDEGTKVRRDFQKHPLGTYDPVSRTLYVEGLPLTLGVDDLKKFFSDYGQVKLVEVPQHRETREPRGFAFVEFGDVQEADAALRGCNGLWPSMWPSRFDGKKLRLMWKAEWHQQCREYKLLQATSRGPTFEGRPKGDPPATPSRTVPSVPDVPTVPDVRDGADEAAVTESGATGSTEPAASAAESSEVVEKPRPSRTPGCLVKLTGFSGDDELLCTLAIRQFAEHAVTVEYCDYVPSASTALLRLKCPEDTATLLEDMKLTGRMLGCQQPTAEVLGREEEEKYWQDVMQRAQQRGPKSDARSHDTKQTAKRREPENVVTRIRRWRPVSNPNRSKFRAGFTNTAGGSANFVASGFGKRKEKRAPKVIPPRKREEEAGPSASSKAKKVEKEKEKVPLVPPPSPFQLPGTTRKRRRGTQVPPPSPAALPPPSPCGCSESMSPESDAASAEPPLTGGAGNPPPEPPEGDLEFDPDDIVSMMEDFH